MNELITIKDGATILDVNVAKKIAEFKRQAKEIEDAEEKLREQILNEMESKNIKSIETDELLITYKASYDKEQFQQKKLREDNPDLYDSYIKISPVKASVSIKLKEEKA